MPDISAVRAFLDDEHLELVDRLDAFVADELAGLPEPDDDNKAREQARQLMATLGARGWLEPIIKQDYRACSLIRDGLASASTLADSVFALQALGATPLLIARNEEQAARWLGPTVAGEAMGAFAMTESEAGSDIASISTTAVRDGDDYVLNGAKTLISNAGIADYYCLFASTDPDAGAKGLSCFIIAADTPGLRFVRPLVMSVPHPLGEIELEDCRLPASCRLGEEGEGFSIGMATLDALRFTVGAAACGIAGRALAEALRHAIDREQFGKPLAEFQLVQDKLARMVMDLTAARLLVYRAAWEKDKGAERVSMEAAMAKAYATEAAQRIVDAAVQILGGRGVLEDHVVDRLYRSVRSLRIYEGTTEIQHLIIAGHLVRQARQRRESGDA